MFSNQLIPPRPIDFARVPARAVSSEQALGLPERKWETVVIEIPASRATIFAVGFLNAIAYQI